MIKFLIKTSMLLLTMIISFNCQIDPKHEFIKTKKVSDSVLNELYKRKHIYESFGIDPYLGIAQAILEQGWKLNNNYRIYNISCNVSHNCETVLDAGKWKSYRIYESLDEAIIDYCKVVNKYFPEVITSNDQILAMGNSNYAEDPEYATKLMSVYKTVKRKLNGH